MARYRKNKTKHINVSYTEIIDLQTVAGKTSIIGFHTPIGVNPVRRLRGLYASFRFQRYNGCSVTMVPAANLPIDPLGLTGVVGTTDLMDPRDALNPIITHGCHGEHLGRILDNIYSEGVTNFGLTGTDTTSSALTSDFAEENSDSANKLEIPNATDDALSRYYQCLTDVKWKKHSIQSPLSWRLRPLVNRVAMTNPLVPYNDYNIDGGVYPGKVISPAAGDADVSAVSTGYPGMVTPEGHVIAHAPETPLYNGTAVQNDDFGIVPQLFTNGVTRMSWLPTTRLTSSGDTRWVTLPKQFMGVMILPPSYNVEQFFRLSIRHSYSFMDFTTSLGSAEIGEGLPGNNTNSYFNWVDYDVTTKETPYKYVEASSMDMIDASADVIADGVR